MIIPLKFNFYQFSVKMRLWNNPKNQKYLMWLTKIDITSRNKVDIENNYFCLSSVAIAEMLMQKDVFFFYTPKWIMCL